MANIFNQNPIILDTSWTKTTIPAALTAIANAGPQIFRRIVWQGGTAGDTILFFDIDGNTILQGTCGVTDEDVLLWDNAGGSPFPFKQSQWGVTIPTGVVSLYK